jgi:hypothetical protein
MATTLLLVAALLGCGGGKQPGSQDTALEAGAAGPDLAGYWVTNSWLSQLGEAEERLCLTSSGEYRSALWSQGAVIPENGTYRIDGGVIHFTSSSRKYDQPFSFKDDVLVFPINDSQVKEYRYLRRGRTCPADLGLPRPRIG